METVNSCRQQSVFLGFPNHTQNNGDITDVTDFNDGLMMVEFLNSLANLPHVPPGMNPVSEEINHATQDVNSLQNEMSLHNGEVLPLTTKAIYFFGEIIILSSGSTTWWLFNKFLTIDLLIYAVGNLMDI